MPSITGKELVLCGGLPYLCESNVPFRTNFAEIFFLTTIFLYRNVLITFQTSLIQGMGFPIAAEVSSLKLRAKTLSLGVMAQAFCGWLVQFTVPYMYNVDSGNLGARTGFVFAGLSVLLIIGAWVLVPETSGLTAEEIDRAYNDKVAVRKFQQRVGSGEVGA